MKRLILNSTIIIILLFQIQVNGQRSENLSLIRDQIIMPENQIIVINLWNTRYPNEIQKLNKLVDKYREEPVVFLAISDEETTEINAFLKKNPFIYEHIIDGEKIFNKFQNGMFKIYPMHIIIDQNGEVSFKKKNISKNIEKKLIKKIDLLLKNNSIDGLIYPRDQYTIN